MDHYHTRLEGWNDSAHLMLKMQYIPLHCC